MNGLIIQWGHSGDTYVTLPLSYTSKDTYTVASSSISNQDNSNVWYSESYRPYSANQLVRRNAYTFTYITIGY